MEKLRDADTRILMALEPYPQGLFLRQITAYARISSVQNAWKKCKRLVRLGYVRKRDSLYLLTQQGLNHSSRATRKGLNEPQETGHKPIPARLHAFGLRYPLKDRLGPKDAPMLLSMAGISAEGVAMKNNSYGLLKVGSITAKLHSRALELYSKDIYTDSRTRSIDLEAELKPRFDAIALDIEARLGRVASFRLVRIAPDVLQSSIIRQHYAEESHPAAEAAEQSPIILARHPADGQRRLGIDMSRGFREWEYYHRLTADADKDTLDSQFNAVLDGEISLLDIGRLNGIVASQEMKYARQFEIVDRLTKQVELHLRIMQKIDARLRQRRLFE